ARSSRENGMDGAGWLGMALEVGTEGPLSIPGAERTGARVECRPLDDVVEASDASSSGGARMQGIAKMTQWRLWYTTVVVTLALGVPAPDVHSDDNVVPAIAAAAAIP